MSSSKFFALCLLLPAVVSAANDWNTPCLNGTCSYDLHNSTSTTSHSAGGSLWIGGSTTAISDLTAAAGWTILDCDPQGHNQSIRAYCSGDNSTCSHLYQNGAVGTIVRLPDNCGRMPFARIAEEWSHLNQTIPGDNLPANASVRGITLDTQWHQINPSHHGQVQMFLQGASGVAGNTTALNPPPSSGVSSRSLWGDIKKTVQKAVSDIEQTFTYNKSGSTPISVEKTFNIFSKTAQCSAFTAGLTVDATASVTADIDYGLALAGTIVPPEVTSFSLVAGFDADLVGTLDIELLASAQLSSGQMTLFNYGLPGLDFPGILTVGPSFQIDAQADLSVEADVELSVDLAYQASGAKLYFPNTAGSSFGTFKPSDTNIKLSADPTIGASGTLSAHVTPMFVFGLSAIDGLATANVNLNVDASADVTASLSKTLTPGGSFNGCFEVDTALSVNAVADGDFFNIFKKSASVTLFSHSWDLYKKCFGNQARLHARDIPRGQLVKRSGLTCGSTPKPAARVSVTSETIPAASVGTGN